MNPTDQQLAAGHELSPIVREMSSVRLIMYAGATWDWHRLHYDAPYADGVNLPAPIVDGQHFGGIFVEQALAAAAPTARVRSMSMRFRSMVFVGETITMTGTVSKVEADPDSDGMRAILNQELKVDDRLCATAVTEVSIPRQDG